MSWLSDRLARMELPTLVQAGDDLRALGDLGYEGESDTITVAFKKPKVGRLTLIRQQLNKVHNSVQAQLHSCPGSAVRPDHLNRHSS